MIKLLKESPIISNSTQKGRQSSRTGLWGGVLLVIAFLAVNSFVACRSVEVRRQIFVFAERVCDLVGSTLNTEYNQPSALSRTQIHNLELRERVDCND